MSYFKCCNKRILCMNTENMFSRMKVEKKCRNNGLGYGNGVNP
jgi:hypothetical protein